MSENEPSSPSADIDIHSESFVRDPYAVYDELRPVCPVVHTPANGGHWLVTRFDDVHSIVHDPNTFPSGVPGVSTIPVTTARKFPQIPQDVDPPAHRDYRAIVSPAFAKPVAERFAPQARQIVLERLEPLLDGGDIDLVQDFARPTAATTLAAFLGLPRADIGRWFDWLDRIYHGRLHDRPAAQQATSEFFAYVDELVAGADVAGDGYIGRLRRAELDGRPLTTEEMRGYVSLVIAAGFSTVTDAVSTMLWHLGVHEDQRRQLIADPHLRPAAIEEFLRLYAPVQNFSRSVAADTELRSGELHAGDVVVISYGAANRDAEVFDEPHEFRLDRSPNRHLAFGSGIHLCLGAHLARLEMTTVLEEILRLAPDYRIQADEVVWGPYGDIWGVGELPARLRPDEGDS